MQNRFYQLGIYYKDFLISNSSRYFQGFKRLALQSGYSLKARLAVLYNKIVVLWQSIPQRFKSQTRSGQGIKKVPPGHKYRGYDHSDDEEHRTAEQYNWRRQNVLSVITIIFTSAAVAFAFETFEQTRRQADIAQDTLKEIRDGSLQTDRAIAATEQSAKAAMDQVEVSRNAAMQELRPYVWIRLNDIPRLQANNTVSIRRRFSNTGKSAALSTQRTTRIAFLTSLPANGDGLPYPSDQEVSTAPEIDFVAPGAERETFTVTPNAISLEIWNNVLAHKGLLWVEWGTVRYKDTFGQTYHLWFCNTWDGQGEATQHCPRGNRID